MRVFLILFSVIMFYIRVVFSKTRAVTDFTEQCVKGRQVATYLTYGGGETDFFLGMVASTGQLDCTFKYFVSENHHIIAFIEFPDNVAGGRICLREYNTVIMVSRTFSVDVCEYLQTFGITTFLNIGPDRVDIGISSQHDLSTVKMTVTALRDPGDAKCHENEVECIQKGKVFCMNIETQCDGFANCGSTTEFDEDLEICQGSKITPLIIISSIIMTVVSFWLIIAVIVVLMPKRRETFVYKLDENITLFDVEMGHGNFDINLQVLLREDTRKSDQVQEEQKHRSITRKQSSSKTSKHRTSSIKKSS